MGYDVGGREGSKSGSLFWKSDSGDGPTSRTQLIQSGVGVQRKRECTSDAGAAGLRVRVAGGRRPPPPGGRWSPRSPAQLTAIIKNRCLSLFDLQCLLSDHSSAFNRIHITVAFGMLWSIIKGSDQNCPTDGKYAVDDLITTLSGLACLNMGDFGSVCCQHPALFGKAPSFGSPRSWNPYSCI